jgi:hypothetical protein
LLLAAAFAGSAPAPVQACIITCPPDWCSDCHQHNQQCGLANCQCVCLPTTQS